MKYEKFSEIWDKYIPSNVVFVAEPETIQALIEYGQGNKTKIKEVRKLLE